jgi:hypothetical protein
MELGMCMVKNVVMLMKISVTRMRLVLTDLCDLGPIPSRGNNLLSLPLLLDLII